MSTSALENVKQNPPILTVDKPVNSPRAEETAIPFFPYPQLFLPEEEELVRIFRHTCRRGAFILQDDLFGFEQNFARFLGTSHAIGVANATDGLTIALRATLSGKMLRPGSEVIFSSHTMVATAAAIHFAGCVPVPVECGADHLIDAAAVEAAITPRTVAIIPTQLNGRTADMDALTGLAERNALLIVEDAAQALGSRFRGRCAGTFGAASAFSFYPAKLLGCLGDGGAVVTNDATVAARVAALHDHGRAPDGEVIMWGFNSRLDNLQAAILDFRLTKFAAVIARRRELAKIYRQRLAHVAEVVLPPGPEIAARPPFEKLEWAASKKTEQDATQIKQADAANGGHFDVYQNYEIEADQRDGLRAFLAQKKIGTLLPWGGRGVHQFEGLGMRAHLPFTDSLFARMLLLPMHPWLSEDDVERIAQAIAEFYGSAR